MVSHQVRGLRSSKYRVARATNLMRLIEFTDMGGKWVRAHRVSAFKKGDRIKCVWPDMSVTMGVVSGIGPGFGFLVMHVHLSGGLPNNFSTFLDDVIIKKRAFRWVK